MEPVPEAVKLINIMDTFKTNSQFFIYLLFTFTGRVQLGGNLTTNLTKTVCLTEPSSGALNP